MSDDLKLVETSALLMLFEAAREVPNTYLKELGFELKAADRRKLEKRGLIDVRVENRKVHLGLSDKGWSQALAIIGHSPVPAGSGYRGVVIHRLAASISRYLDRADVPAADFFVAEHIAEPAGADIAQHIRTAYADLAPPSGEQVTLARIRAALPGHPRERVDEALVALSRQPDVFIDPESNQKTLTPAERAAAVRIGNQDKHLIRISSR